MSPMLLIPIALGAVAVLQGAINRRVAASIGLPSAVLLTHSIALLCAFALWLWMRSAPASLPSVFQPSQPGGRSEWWYVIPGLAGFLFVCGLPLAFARIGAFQSLLLLIVAQLCIGLVWDQLVEGRPLTLTRMVGALVTMVGAALVLRR